MIVPMGIDNWVSPRNLYNFVQPLHSFSDFIDQCLIGIVVDKDVLSGPY